MSKGKRFNKVNNAKESAYNVLADRAAFVKPEVPETYCEVIPTWKTIVPSGIDLFNGQIGYALVDFNSGRVIFSLSFSEDNNAQLKLNISSLAYTKPECDVIDIYDSNDTGSRVEIFAKTYRPYADVTIRLNKTRKPDISKIAKLVGKAQAERIANYTDADISFVNLQTREIEKLEVVGRSFAGNISIILTSNRSGYHFMVAHMPFVA